MTYTQAKYLLRDIGRYELEALLDRYGEDMVSAAIEVDINPNDIQKCYQGKYDNDEDFVYQLVDSLYDLHGIDRIVHIDWEGTARDIMIERDIMIDYTECNHHYFRVT